MKTDIIINTKPFSLKARVKSFTYAWSGFNAMLRIEPNASIHLAGTITVVLLSVLLKISAKEIMLLVMVVASVWTAELFNTAIEKAIDFVSTEIHPQIKLVKDLAAAAVLITSVAALLVGAIIFIPKIIAYA
jgi:diacylglycerol kinase